MTVKWWRELGCVAYLTNIETPVYVGPKGRCWAFKCGSGASMREQREVSTEMRRPQRRGAQARGWRLGENSPEEMT